MNVPAGGPSTRGWTGIVTFIFRDASVDVAGIRTVLALRVEAGLLPSPPPDPARYFDLTYFERAAGSG